MPRRRYFMGFCLTKKTVVYLRGTLGEKPTIVKAVPHRLRISPFLHAAHPLHDMRCVHRRQGCVYPNLSCDRSMIECGRSRSFFRQFIVSAIINVGHGQKRHTLQFQLTQLSLSLSCQKPQQIPPIVPAHTIRLETPLNSKRNCSVTAAVTRNEGS